MIAPITLWQSAGRHVIAGIDLPPPFAQDMRVLNNHGYALHRNTCGKEYYITGPDRVAVQTITAHSQKMITVSIGVMIERVFRDNPSLAKEPHK